MGVAPGTVGLWAEACVAQLGTCPPELRATVLGAAAFSAFYAGDVQLAQRLAEDALAEPASSDPNSFGQPRVVLSRTYSLTGQPERGASIAREGRHEAEKWGSEPFVGVFLAIEAMAWTDAGDHAAARRPAMEAVEAARRIGIPALSALACYAAAAAIWIGELQTALLLVEETLALTRVGALDSVLGFALSLAVAIRARNGDLPGALAVLQEATVLLAGEGNRLGLGMTLERAAAVLVRLGEFEPAAVLAGVDSARFALSVAAIYPDERRGIDEAQATARRALGEAAYSSALRQGAAMNDDEVTDYALGQFRRVAVLIGEPGAQAPESPPGMARRSGRE
jgi:ATP/maltotriose-dependent transcriptional regulator MalT